MGITSRLSIGRDTLIRYVFEDNFFDKIPELSDLKDLFAECKAAYKKELDQKGCSCRVTADWAKSCLVQMLDRVEAARKTDHELVRKFIRLVGRYGDHINVDKIGVTILHDKTYDIFVDAEDAPV